jgi:hypothetical protein
MPFFSKTLKPSNVREYISDKNFKGEVQKFDKVDANAFQGLVNLQEM